MNLVFLSLFFKNNEWKIFVRQINPMRAGTRNMISIFIGLIGGTVGLKMQCAIPISAELHMSGKIISLGYLLET
jgi:hypothetical protein